MPTLLGSVPSSWGQKAKYMKTKHEEILAQFEVDKDGWWSAQIVDPPELQCCITQGKTLRTARKRLREVLALEWESEHRAATVRIRERLSLPDRAGTALELALEARARMEALTKEVETQTRKAAQILSDRGVGTRDVGELLGISQARVSQVLRS